MSAIPDEIMDAAGEACSHIAEYGQPAQETVARAILAERERCAKIAARYGNFYPENDHGLGYSRAANSIATAIIRGEP